MQPRFKVGDEVRYLLTTGGIGLRALTVTKIFPLGSGWRILATRNDGRGSIEAAERFFELETN